MQCYGYMVFSMMFAFIFAWMAHDIYFYWHQND